MRVAVKRVLSEQVGFKVLEGAPYELTVRVLSEQVGFKAIDSGDIKDVLETVLSEQVGFKGIEKLKSATRTKSFIRTSGI